MIKYDSAGNSYVATQTCWRRDLDIRPLVLFAGLNRPDSLLEVYKAPISSYRQSIKHIHELLQPNSTVPQQLIDYSDTGYLGLNKELYSAHNELRPIAHPHLNDALAIESAMHKETNLPHAVKLFTGVKYSPAKLAGFEWNSSRAKKIVHFPAFTSTTTDIDTAARFSDIDQTTTHHESDHHGIILPGARHIIELNFPQKIHAAISMSKVSAAWHEDEILLGRGHEVILHPRPTLLTTGGYSTPVYVWKSEPGMKLPYTNFGATHSYNAYD